MPFKETCRMESAGEWQGGAVTSRKPLARYSAMEGALAPGLLRP